MEKLNKTLKNNEKAITLIALVITIIVLLILAGISISMLSGDNGILQQTTTAKTRTIHANVLEQMQLEASAYTVDKTTGNYSNSLIDYLKSKSIISDISGEEDKWLINVTTLLGSNQSMGIGTYPNDVYVLEKQDTSTGNIVNTKVATTTPIKIAATSTSQVTYNVKYYGNNASENLTIGDLNDYSDNNINQYSVQGNGAAHLIDVETAKPTSFEKIYIIFNGEKVDITDAKTHRNQLYTGPEEFEELEWDFVGPEFFDLMYENGYGELSDGTYEFIIEKDGKEYRGNVEIGRLT